LFLVNKFAFGEYELKLKTKYAERSIIMKRKKMGIKFEIKTLIK